MDYKDFYQIEDFKEMFYRDRNFDFQPYPLWTKTAYDENDIVSSENEYYKSLVNNNGASLTDTESWELLLNPTEEEIASSTEYVAPTAYNKDDKVIYVVNYKYKIFVSLIDDNYTEPTSASWEESEDESIDDFILDRDIEKAMNEAANRFNPSLLSNDLNRKIAFSYLTAFFLVYDLQTAKDGVSSSWSNPVKRRTVGKMSVWYEIPTTMKSYPSYQFLARNQYGVKYFELIRAKLVGNVKVFLGNATNM